MDTLEVQNAVNECDAAGTPVREFSSPELSSHQRREQYHLASKGEELPNSADPLVPEAPPSEPPQGPQDISKTVPSSEPAVLKSAADAIEDKWERNITHMHGSKKILF